MGESAAEAAIREIREETGLTVRIDRLIGVYSKYFDEYKNGDMAQTITVLFACTAIGGMLKTCDETLDLKYFSPDGAPALFNQQHRDMLEDVIHRKSGVYR